MIPAGNDKLNNSLCSRNKKEMVSDHQPQSILVVQVVIFLVDRRIRACKWGDWPVFRLFGCRGGLCTKPKSIIINDVEFFGILENVAHRSTIMR